MMTANKEIWISAGYENFALTGPSGLKIEPLAKKVGKNKSSFYHYFADLELFMEELLKYHLQQSKIIAEKDAISSKLLKNAEYYGAKADRKLKYSKLTLGLSKWLKGFSGI